MHFKQRTRQTAEALLALSGKKRNRAEQRFSPSTFHDTVNRRLGAVENVNKIMLLKHKADAVTIKSQQLAIKKLKQGQSEAEARIKVLEEQLKVSKCSHTTDKEESAARPVSQTDVHDKGRDLYYGTPSTPEQNVDMLPQSMRTIDVKNQTEDSPASDDEGEESPYEDLVQPRHSLKLKCGEQLLSATAFSTQESMREWILKTKNSLPFEPGKSVRVFVCSRRVKKGGIWFARVGVLHSLKKPTIVSSGLQCSLNKFNRKTGRLSFSKQWTLSICLADDLDDGKWKARTWAAYRLGLDDRNFSETAFRDLMRNYEKSKGIKTKEEAWKLYQEQKYPCGECIKDFFMTAYLKHAFVRA